MVLSGSPGPKISEQVDIASWSALPFLISDRVTGSIIQATQAIADVTGHSLEELQGMSVVDLGLWPSLQAREEVLQQQPVSVPQRSICLMGVEGKEHEALLGWQVADWGGNPVVSEVIIDISFATETRARLQRLDRFRARLSEVLRESLDRGLDASFYERVLSSAVDTIPGAQTASLLVREADGRYRFKAAVGYDLKLLQTISFTSEQMSLGQDDEPQIVHGYSSNSDLPDDMRAILNSAGPTEQIKVSMVSQVKLDGEPVAVLILDNLLNPDAFEPETLSMALDYAQHLAVLLQRFRFEEALWHQAHYDKLSGLPNRRLFETMLSDALTHTRDSGSRLAVCFIDLDNFKSINDTYGHTFGDKVVAAVTRRLASVLPAKATLSRWGGDELVALVPDIADESEADAVAAQLLLSAQEPYTFPGLTINTTISLGVAHYPTAGTSGEELLQNADVALYRAKQVGRNTYAVFDDEMRQSVQLQAQLRPAVRNREIELHYHPRYDMNGQLVAVEALARWDHPERGLLPASAFIGIAEHAGMMHQLGAHLFEQAVQQARNWLDHGLNVAVAFNLSSFQLQATGLVQQVEATLRRHALPPHLIELQVTESAALVDVPDAASKLKRLRQLGVRLLLDGVGSGFSSLAMLRNLQLDGIKISREFVMGVAAGSQQLEGGIASQDVVLALVGLGRDLGVQIIAEGVETEAQFEFIKRAGATQVQGFLFNEVLPADQATKLLLSLDSEH